MHVWSCVHAMYALLTRRIVPSKSGDHTVTIFIAAAFLSFFFLRSLSTTFLTHYRKDVQWLGLQEGQDFAMMIDLAGLLKVWNPARGRYVYFGLDHYAKVWLGDARTDDEAHDAVADAAKSVRLFMAYAQAMYDPYMVYAVGARVLATPVAPSFAKQNPTFDGVCMGNKTTCKCGSPFYS